jgi:hypothetical protein
MTPKIVSHIDPTNEVARFARSEFEQYMSKLADSEGQPDSVEFVLDDEETKPSPSPSPVYDGFFLEESGKTLRIRASVAKGLLNGAYTVLRLLGVRFPFPGVDRIPDSADWARVRAACGKWHIPSFRHRILHFDNLYLSAEMIDWSGKLCINMLQQPLHLFNMDLGVRPELSGMVRQRGIEMNIGCHGFDNWLPPSRYAREHPEWYSTLHPARMGVFEEAHPDKFPPRAGQLCLSNRQMIRQFADNVVAFLRKHPEVRTVNFWPNDMVGGWCECENCLALEPDPDHLDPQTGTPSRSASYLSFIRRLGPLVHEEIPDTRIDFCAFYEYATPPLNLDVVPQDEYYLGFLIDDYFGCQLHGHGAPCNRPRIEAAHRKWREVFGGEIYAVGYYADLCKTQDFPLVMNSKIREDFGYLRDDIGIDSVMTLVVCAGLEYLLSAAFQNIFSFASLGWDHHRTPADVLDELAEGISPRTSTAVREYLGLWDDLGRRKPDLHGGWVGMDFAPPDPPWDSVIHHIRLKELVDEPMVKRLASSLEQACRDAAGDPEAEKVLDRMSESFGIFRLMRSYEPAHEPAEQTELLDRVRQAVAGRGGFPGSIGGTLKWLESRVKGHEETRSS